MAAAPDPTGSGGHHSNAAARFQLARLGVANPAVASRDRQRGRIGAAQGSTQGNDRIHATATRATPIGRHGHQQRAVDRPLPQTARHQVSGQWPAPDGCADAREERGSATTNRSATEVLRW